MNRKQVTQEEITDFCAKEDIVSYSSMISRPGFYAWLVEVEYTKFKPDTDANEGFHLFFSKFPEESPVMAATMVTAAMDRSGKEFAESILWKHGLKKTQEGYIPSVIDADGVQAFFLQGPNIFYLENSGASNVIYQNDPAKLAIAFEHESKQAQKFFDEHQEWINSPKGKAIADEYWKKHPEGRVY